MPERKRGTRGEGSVVSVPDATTGETRYLIKIPYRDDLEKPQVKRKLLPRGTTLAQAHREKRRLLGERDKDQIRQTSRETMSELGRRRLASLRATGAQNTADIYSRMFTNYIEPAVGHLAAGKLERKHVRAMLETIVQSGKQPTAVIVKATLTSMLDVLIDEGVLKENVARLVKISSIVRSNGMVAHRPTHKRVPSTEHVALLVARLAPRPEYGVMVRILATTGMRLGELLGMAYPRLDPETGVFQIWQNIAHRNGMFQLGTTKTGETREVVLDADILEHLEQWTHQTLTRRMARGRGAWLRTQSFFHVRPGFPDLSPDLIFTRPDGRPVTPDSVRNVMAAACHALGIPLITPHMLRAFVDTELHKARVDDATRREWLGHENAAMDKVYVRTDLDRLRAAGQVIIDQLRRAGGE